MDEPGWRAGGVDRRADERVRSGRQRREATELVEGAGGGLAEEGSQRVNTPTEEEAATGGRRAAEPDSEEGIDGGSGQVGER